MLPEFFGLWVATFFFLFFAIELVKFMLSGACTSKILYGIGKTFACFEDAKVCKGRYLFQFTITAGWGPDIFGTEVVRVR